jgi:hypothetical protein
MAHTPPAVSEEVARPGSRRRRHARPRQVLRSEEVVRPMLHALTGTQPNQMQPRARPAFRTAPTCRASSRAVSPASVARFARRRRRHRRAEELTKPSRRRFPRRSKTGDAAPEGRPADARLCDGSRRRDAALQDRRARQPDRRAHRSALTSTTSRPEARSKSRIQRLARRIRGRRMRRLHRRRLQRVQVDARSGQNRSAKIIDALSDLVGAARPKRRRKNRRRRSKLARRRISPKRRRFARRTRRPVPALVVDEPTAVAADHADEAAERAMTAP